MNNLKFISALCTALLLCTFSYGQTKTDWISVSYEAATLKTSDGYSEVTSNPGVALSFGHVRELYKGLGLGYEAKFAYYSYAQENLDMTYDAFYVGIGGSVDYRAPFGLIASVGPVFEAALAGTATDENDDSFNLFDEDEDGALDPLNFAVKFKIGYVFYSVGVYAQYQKGIYNLNKSSDGEIFMNVVSLGLYFEI